jgi:methylthioribulose 1-phosphate dehydratase / enolase-phosphatase E1
MSLNNNNSNNKDDVDVDDDMPVSLQLSKPGAGWSNGDIHPQMFPLTRQGKLQLYGSQRRFVHLASGWSRVGGSDNNNQTTNQFSHRTSVSSQGSRLIDKEDADGEAKAVRSLIAQLCETFYKFGWATGTGGGVSIRVGGPDESRPWRVFVAPSGIQKEDMVRRTLKINTVNWSFDLSLFASLSFLFPFVSLSFGLQIGDDVFELDMDRNVVVPPKTPNLRQSACTPLWYVVYRNRPTAKSVIHTHSQHAVLATLLDPTESLKTLRITHLEMLKGVGHHAYDDMLEIPIIDNRPSEDLLAEQLEEAIQAYPSCNCVLVRRHGLYVWGDSWEQAKTQCESFDYLFQCVVEMKKMGLDPSFVPLHGTYRVEETRTADADEEVSAQAAGGEEKKDNIMDSSQLPPVTKKHKSSHHHNPITTTDTTNIGWNASSIIDNAQDLASNTSPILPRDAKYLLLDIEGCTTAISFVKDVLFPFVLQHLETYVNSLAPTEYNGLAEALANDLTVEQKALPDVDVTDCSSMVRYMVDNDLKLPALKAMQGQMWKSGYEKGDIHGHVYADVVPMLQWMQTHGVHVYIYSSGSVQAQKLLFQHSNHGNLLEFINGHFDITTSGNKKVAQSYVNICKSLDIDPSQLVFCSDAEAELEAAREANVGHVIMTIRPGNAPLTAKGRKSHPQVFSMLQLCGL